MLTHCLPQLVDATFTDHDYEPKVLELGNMLFKELPPIANPIDPNEILALDNTPGTPEARCIPHVHTQLPTLTIST